MNFQATIPKFSTLGYQLIKYKISIKSATKQQKYLSERYFSDRHFIQQKYGLFRHLLGLNRGERDGVHNVFHQCAA